MRIILCTFLIIVSLLSSIFFSKYKGSTIPNPFLWYLLFVFIGFLGFWLFASSYKRTRSIIDKAINSNIEQFKSRSEKLKLNLDFCEFKSGSYYHEVRDENANMVNLLVPTSTAAFHNPTKNEKVVQSYLIYNYENKVEKIISQSFPFDEVTLKYYVLNKNIVLYIDRFDKRKYLFELENRS